MSNSIDTSALGAQLSGGSKRVKVHDAQIVFKCPKAAKDLVHAEAERRRLDDADILREALSEYFEKRGLVG